MNEVKKTYRAVYRWFMIAAIPAIYFVIFPTTFFYISCISLFGTFACAVFIMRNLWSLNSMLPEKLPMPAFLLGGFIVVGGASFDIINTIIQTPDLSFEGNPVARLFFDNNFSVLFVYVLGFLGQSLIILFALLLWAVFLKTYPILLREIKNNPPKSFICTMLGGPNASYFDLFLGKVEPLYTVPAVGPLLVGSFLYRWYLGLEWLELVPISRVLVPVLAILFSLILYLYFAHKQLAYQIKKPT
jgi:hypothetical protein